MFFFFFFFMKNETETSALVSLLPKCNEHAERLKCNKTDHMTDI